ncbi:PREDICTED: homeobox protein engrailed-1-like [Lipotes vexillifer]|uniref:Homeobox protein engrailed-1-like n=1 Tax=Lipotes vexillifer TaxID=118797 RepID=A0A340XVU3_LIPVE|nr:PREDICTED: homeobox protein engrailed-1-like [Lipotes vexillifer]
MGSHAVSAQKAPAPPTARRTRAPTSPQLTTPAPALDHKRRWVRPGRTGPSGAGSQAARRPTKARICEDRSAPGSPRLVSFGRAASPLFACVPVPGLPHCLPTREAKAPGNGEGASSQCASPQPVPARRCLCCGAARAGARPPVSVLRRSPGESRPGRRLLLALPGSRPLPGRAGAGAGDAAAAHLPARSARGCTEAATASEGSGEGGRRRGGSRGSPSAADRAPPAAGEGAGRVSAGRHWEEGNGLG